MSAPNEKLVIYQVLVRLFGNTNTTRKPNGTVADNGCGKMSAFSDEALRMIRELGCNCVWYTGLLQQASATDYSAYGIPTQNPQVLKGKAGSPYAITDYYSVSCDLADNPARRMDELDALVKRTHQAGLKMIIDFVPNHVARQYKSVTKPEGVEDLGASDRTSLTFDPNNNFYYCREPLHLDRVGIEGDYTEVPAKVSGNDVFSSWPSRDDWYETVKLNYGVDYCGGGRNCFDPIPSTWHKMLDILLYWAARGVDGFRCDMAFMVPVDFWHWAIARVKEQYPHVIFIAEIYDPSLCRSYINYGGFDYLYDKVGLYDTLRRVVECKSSASDITRCWQSVGDIQGQMLNFLENHDEQRVASRFFADDARKGKPAVAVSCLMNTNPYMLYFGQELGERGMDQEGFSGLDGRTTIFDYWSLDGMSRFVGKQGDFDAKRLTADERALRDWYVRILTLANSCKALQRGSFYDLTYCNYGNPHYDVHRQFAFLRNYEQEVVLVVANFDADDKELELNIPAEAWAYVGVTSRRRSVQNLITGKRHTIDLDTARPFSIRVKGYDAAVWRFQR